MVFSFLRRAHANLDLQIDGDRFSPGDTIKISLSISSRQGFDVRRGAVILECVETYWEWVTRHTGRTTSRRKRKRRHTIAETYTDFMGEGAIAKGIPQRYDVTITAPPDAPPSVSGKSANLHWQIKLSLDVPGARDVHREQTVVIALRQPIPATGDDRDGSSTIAEDPFGEGTMRLEMEGNGARAGEALRGKLKLTTKEACQFEEVRVELERYEEAGETSSNVTADTIVLQRDASFPSMYTKEWPFTLTIPDGIWPTTRVSRTVVRWRVKGICARSLRRDHRVEAEVVVR